MRKSEQAYLNTLKKDKNSWWDIPARFRNDDDFIKDAICINYEYFDMIAPEKAVKEDIQNVAIESSYRYLNSMKSAYRRYLHEEEAEELCKELELRCEDLIADKIERSIRVVERDM